MRIQQRELSEHLLPTLENQSKCATTQGTLALLNLPDALLGRWIAEWDICHRRLLRRALLPCLSTATLWSSGKTCPPLLWTGQKEFNRTTRVNLCSTQEMTCFSEAVDHRSRLHCSVHLTTVVASTFPKTFYLLSPMSFLILSPAFRFL